MSNKLLSVRLVSSMWDMFIRGVLTRCASSIHPNRCIFFSEKNVNSKSYRHRDSTIFYPMHYQKLFFVKIFVHFLLWFLRPTVLTGVFDIENTVENTVEDYWSKAGKFWKYKGLHGTVIPSWVMPTTFFPLKWPCRWPTMTQHFSYTTMTWYKLLAGKNTYVWWYDFCGKIQQTTILRS